LTLGARLGLAVVWFGTAVAGVMTLKGDPGGSLTGNPGDIVMTDPSAGLTTVDVVN
jgi:hypothetical protein